MLFLLLFLFAGPLLIWVFFIVAATVAVHFLPFILLGLAIWLVVHLSRRSKSRG